MDDSWPQEGGHTVRRTTLLMLALMAAALVVLSGAALARNTPGTEQGEKIVGTKYADHINSWGATTWFWVIGAPTRYAVVTTTISNTVVGATTLSTVRVASGTWSMAAEASTRAMWTPRTG
jgi:hypothetical protein